MNKGKGNYGCARVFVIFWLGILAIGFLEDHHGVMGILMVIALVYVVMAEPINKILSKHTGVDIGGSLDERLHFGNKKAGSGKTAGSASAKRKSVEKATYESVIGDYKDTPVAYIAEMTGLSEDKVIGDLMRLSDEKVFEGGHFDDVGNFILPSNTRKRDTLKTAETDVKIKCPFCGESIPGSLRFCYYCGEALDVIKEIDTIRIETVAEIKDASDKVPEESVKKSVLNIAELTNKIISKYEEEPELIKDSSKFREYYLPNTVNAITNYAELCSHLNLDKDEQDLKSQIEKSLPTIEEAFSRILKKISIDGVYDLSADVSTLETVLKQDGLTKSDFE